MGKFRKAAHRWTGQLDANGIADATVDNFGLLSAAGLPTDTEINMTIHRVDSSGRISLATEEIIKGTVSGNRIINVQRGVHGTAQAHPASTVVEVILAASQWNDMIDGILKEHSQDGTHSPKHDGGWLPVDGDMSIVSIDGATTVLRVTGDANTRYTPGMRLRYKQTQPLTAYWPFDTNYDPAVGIYSITNFGSPTYTTGKYGNALTLNGSSALGISGNDAFFPTGDFHIHMNIKTNNKSETQIIYQSRAGIPNIAGIFLQTARTTGYLQFCVGNNTTTSYGDSQGFRLVNAPVDVCDGVYHTIDIAYRNNYVQIYIDGELEGYGYMITPAYAPPSQMYIRIGCANVLGTNNYFFTGQIDDLFIINGYALDESTVRSMYRTNTAIGVEPMVITKHAIIQDVGQFTGTNTDVIVWGGTDYATINAPITEMMYSSHRSPHGFPSQQQKWQIRNVYVGLAMTQSPTGNTIYNNGGSIIVPPGKWSIGAEASLLCYGEAVTRMYQMQTGATLSDAPNTINYDIYTRAHLLAYASGMGLILSSPIKKENVIKTKNKKTFYLNSFVAQPNTKELGFEAYTVLYAINSLL